MRSSVYLYVFDFYECSEISYIDVHKNIKQLNYVCSMKRACDSVAEFVDIGKQILWPAVW